MTRNSYLSSCHPQELSLFYGSSVSGAGSMPLSFLIIIIIIIIIILYSARSVGGRKV
jgi:hypothetical protein